MFNLFSLKKNIKNKNLLRKFLFLPTTNYQLSTKSGFMLVEMIVSVAIFSVVMTVGIGSLLTIINANKRAQAFKTVANNLNLAMESMSRDIRTGYDYDCGSSSGKDCEEGDKSIYFTSKSGNEGYVYEWNQTSYSIDKSTNGGSQFTAITSPEIDIDDLKFYVLGTIDPLVQPKVVIVVRAHSGEREKSRIEFDLQTTISQRKR